MLPSPRHVESLTANGFAVLEDVFPSRELDAFRESLDAALASASTVDGVRRRHGTIFAARNLGRLWPDLRHVVRRLENRVDLSAVVDGTPRLVRALFFDKPPRSSWSLPWHRDTNVAVRPGAGSSATLSMRAGVPHMVASNAVLSAMATLRVHLDPQTRANGALEVVPGTHATSDADVQGGRVLEADAGSVLMFRPLLLHRSSAGADRSAPRRVVQLEYSGAPQPGPGCSWAPVW